MKKLLGIAIINLFCNALAFGQLFDNQEHFTRKDSLRGNLTELRSCFDVSYYDLQLTVDIANKHIKGSNKIYYKVISDFHTLQIDLFSNLEINNIYFNGEALRFDREFDAVFVHFPKKQQKGSSGMIQVEYQGNPRIAKNAPWDGGFSFDTDQNGNPWVGVSCQGLGASVWWPNKDHLSDEPDSMQITAAVPADLKCIANGNLRSERDITGGLKEFVWFVSYPINNYNVSLNIGKYAHFDDVYTNASGEILALDYYVLDYNLATAKKHFDQVKPMLACFESYLGKYPFYKDGFAMVETPYLGMEHQSGIAYGNQYRTGYLGFDYSGIGLDFDYIIIHETGHEWWGNNVSMQDIADMWIHEGFCTYSEALYVECLFGYDIALNYVNAMKNRVNNNEPIIGNYSVNHEGSGDMYQKGALILNTMRSLVNNDPVWFEIIKGIQKDFAKQTVTTQQIENYIQQKSGKNLSVEFDQYLRNAALPLLEYSLMETEKGLTFSFRWIADAENFAMPLRYINEKGKYIWFTPTLDWQTIELPNMTKTQLKLDETHFYFQSRILNN